ncbi:MAG: FAD:protein FMN transferase [Burkholderiaceae bacterium]|nr:FAD:protein FMN transferase [Burkholderiaceae bacterium]
MAAETALEPLGAGAWRGRFKAMASPCELLVEGADEAQARVLLEAAAAEALRIEAKFSRYRDDSVIAMLHRSRGEPVAVDDETALLLDYAAACHAMSDGLFDVTSGVLREAWRFDGSDRVPTADRVRVLVERIGWHKLHWQRPKIVLPPGMEIDLGGIGKEYAVDRVLALLRSQAALPMLVNFGGDLAVSGLRADGRAWQVGVERPDAQQRSAVLRLDLSAGALATSGDARRYLLKDGVRYGHILDPRDGWPVRGAPRSVTVAAGRCTEAGTLATLAMLQGPRAEEWLAGQGVPHWVLR